MFKVPPELGDDEVSSVNCALAQVIYGLTKANVGVGDHIVIQGAGGLGINAIAVARELGVEQIIVIDGIEERLQLAKEFGADALVDLRSYLDEPARVQRVKELTGGWGADVVLELAGRASVVPEGLQMLGTGGTYLEIGNICQGQTCSYEPSQVVLGGKAILGIMWYDAGSLYKAIRFLAVNHARYPFHKVVAHRYALRDITRAFADHDAGRVHRAAIDPWA